MSASVCVCVCGWAVYWICSKMHFELMEANSCLTISRSDVAVGEKGPSRNVRRLADSLPRPGRVALFLSVCLSIRSYLFLSVSVGLRAFSVLCYIRCTVDIRSVHLFMIFVKARSLVTESLLIDMAFT